MLSLTQLKQTQLKQTKLSDMLVVHICDHADYMDTHNAMLSRVLARIDDKHKGCLYADELWLVEHQDVYTLGQAGKDEHILYKTDTPIIKTDRGGQVTWHGAGQLVVYWLWDLNRLGMGVRDLVSHAEQAIEDVVNEYLPNGLRAKAQKQAPGVYVYHDEQMIGKIASLGFKIKHGHSYHGIAINLINDLSAFNAINPCGYQGMKMVKLAQFCEVNVHEFTLKLLDNIKKRHQKSIALRG